MSYEINVARRIGQDSDTRYLHLFATHERSLPTRDEVRRVLPLLLKAFPEPFYKITVSRTMQVSEPLDLETLEPK